MGPWIPLAAKGAAYPKYTQKGLQAHAAGLSFSSTRAHKSLLVGLLSMSSPRVLADSVWKAVLMLGWQVRNHMLGVFTSIDVWVFLLLYHCVLRSRISYTTDMYKQIWNKIVLFLNQVQPDLAPLPLSLFHHKYSFMMENNEFSYHGINRS